MAFEPTMFAVEKLRRNLDLNPDLARRVTVHHCYLTERDGTEVPHAIYSRWPLKPEPEQHAVHLGMAMDTNAAEARSLDSILEQEADRPVGLVKLDVDGFECSVLRGATKLLLTTRPIFVMEIAPYVLRERGDSLDEFLSFFLLKGYRFHHERTMQPLPTSAAEIEAMIAPGACMNVVALAT
jgi:FkbM family methyltransferase